MIYNFCVITGNTIRVDIYLSALFNNFSRSYIQKMIDRGHVSINGEKISKNIKIKHKDEVTIEIIIEKLTEINPEKMNFDIVYEDNELIVLNKEAGINVHPVPGEDGNKNTLVNGILEHCKDRLPSIGGVQRPGIVHRLDKDTSGLIMIAKSDTMMNYLSDIIKQRNIDKYYIAIVFGKIKDRNFKIESYIGRDPNNRLKMTVVNPVNPKIAITYGEVLEYIENKYTIVKVKIETGRTHQIRVHLSSIGFPIIGDKVYGNIRVNKEVATLFQLHRQALHAYELDLILYGKNVQFKGELKADMKRVIGEITSP
ncbi:MAG: RluA family pseudouridine synthase [Candidatus Gracilibacteria bacterium]|nr:RluA family pseudouridine synthase [Candidatus Gracilibacteria bacterium]